MYYGEEFVEEVRQRNDIVDVISSYINLKRSGNDYFGLCPFHNEKSPSFSVSSRKQFFYCFGCGAAGSVFTFLMRYDNLTYQEAVEQLAERVNMDLPKVTERKEDRERRNLRDSILEVNRLAANYYFSNLKSGRGKEGYAYLEGRGLSVETIVRFGLGFSGRGGGGFYQYAKNKGYGDGLLKQTGLFTYSEKGTYDKFWNRVMFPIMDRNKHVVGFGGRVLGDAKPKYLNSPETPVFEKSRNLYGLNFIHGKQENGMILCEGYMDVIALHQAGFTNAVASLGTSLTEQHAGILKRYTELVYLCYDSDGAGVKAALRAIPILRGQGIQVKVIDMRPYKDPDEFMKGLSRDEFCERIKNAEAGFFYEVEQLKKNYDMNDPESKTRFMNEAAKKCLVFDSEIERTNYIEAFAGKYLVRTDDFRKLVSHQGALMAGINYEKQKKREPGKKSLKKEEGIEKSQAVFLTWIANSPNLYHCTKGIIDASDFVEEPYRQVAEMVYQQYEEQGRADPVMIINRFENVEEQTLVAGIFNRELQALSGDAGQKKAVNDVVRGIKRNSLEHRSRYVTDIGELQKIVEQKKQLQTLQIPLEKL